MPSNTSNYLQSLTFQVPDQKFRVECQNLRPLTQHYVVLDNKDWSNRCVADGYNIGDPLVSDVNGRLYLNFYWSNENEGALALNSTLQGIFNAGVFGDKTVVVTDITGTSQARKVLFANATKPGVFAKLTSATAATSTTTANNSGLPTLLSTGTSPIAQTFYIDPSLVQNATEIYLTSVDLFNKIKPKATGNISGINNPGVSVYLVPTINGVPTFSLITSYPVARREYAEILQSLDSSQSTKFDFVTPVLVSTGQTYAFVIVCDGNEAYTFWSETVGDINVITGSLAATLGNQFIGAFYDITSDTSNWTPVSTMALKFNVNAARFATNGVPISNTSTGIYDLSIGNYEYVDYDVFGSTGRLYGGELVYQPKGAYNGTTSVNAGSYVLSTSGTPFTTFYTSNTEPNYIVVTDQVHTNIRKVVTVTANAVYLNVPLSFTNAVAGFYTTAPVAQAYISDSSVGLRGLKNRTVLVGSAANSSVFFSNGFPIIGEISGSFLANTTINNLIVVDVDPQIHIDVPSSTSYAMSELFGYTTSSNGITASVLDQTLPVQMYSDNIILTNSPVVLLGRSIEQQMNATSFATTPSNSSTLEITSISKNDFVVPSIDGKKVDVYFTTYYINNDYTNENTKYGNAISKEISKKISLASGSYAQDILVYVDAYVPTGSNLKVFAKIHKDTDSIAFDDKDWTLLVQNTNVGVFSSLTNANDYIEYVYGFGSFPNSAFTYSSTVTTSNNSSNITATSNIFSSANIAIGDLVKIYQPLFANTDYMIASVVNVVSNTVITIDQPISNNGVIGSGLAIDLIQYPNQAFRNILNSNVVRYYTTSGNYFDTYDTFSVKVVMLSNNLSIIPNLADVRAVAVSS